MKIGRKDRVVGTGLGVLLLLIVIPWTALAVPQVTNYQGYLTDAGGNPLNGDVAITFRIWDAEVSGTELWSESHAAVRVAEGVFNVVLGSLVPITSEILDGDRYLGMTVGTDSEMSPRLRMTSSPFAIKAADADALGGLPSSEFAPSAHGHTWGEISNIPADFADGVDNTGITVESDPTVPSSLKDGISWDEIAGRPSGLDDGDDVGITIENDPTVPVWIKDGVSWGEISGIPAGFADGTDNTGITTETDPTVPIWIKDGLSWSELSGIPAGFSDGVDNTGITTETDPEVGSNEVNYVPKWDGSALVAGAIYDDGNVGIGTFLPDQKLHVKGLAHFDVGTGHIHISTPGGWPGIIAYSINGNRRDIQFYDDVMTIAVSDSGLAPSNSNGITIGENGNLGVGIGRTLPSEKLQVAGNIRMPDSSHIVNSSGNEVFHTGWRSGFGDYTTINSGYAWGSGEPVSVVASSSGVFFTKGDQSGTPYAETLMKVDTSGNVGIGTTNPVKKLTVRGNLLIQSESTGIDVLELGEGLDYAEGFDVSGSMRVESGSVLVIDPDHPGKLTLSNIAYDTKVAGIVAGAKGLGSGVRLGAGRFDHDVALAGRIYCNVDAGYGEVSPGDLLTTSPTPGYAMKVGDYSRAQGAILGKAMQRLERGQKGQILVLVTLQ
jgi:hypothetical protein